MASQFFPYHGWLHWQSPRKQVPRGELSFLPQAYGGQRSYRYTLCVAATLLPQLWIVQLRVNVPGHCCSESSCVSCSGRPQGLGADAVLLGTCRDAAALSQGMDNSSSSDTIGKNSRFMFCTSSAALPAMSIAVQVRLMEHPIRTSLYINKMFSGLLSIVCAWPVLSGRVLLHKTLVL